MHVLNSRAVLRFIQIAQQKWPRKKWLQKKTQRVLFIASLWTILVMVTTFGMTQTLTVFAASSLTDAFEDIVAVFETDNPGVTVLLSVAGSATLRTQIEQGAPADVFASANVVHMDALREAGLVTDVQRFVGNRLLVVAQPEAGIQTLTDLAREDVRLVVAAPQVPVGSYAREMLEHVAARDGQAVVDAILANIVSEELNVRQVVSKVLLGEADAGVVYQSDALAFAELAVIPIADALNVTAEYPIAVVREANEVDVARAFVDFVLSEAGQQVLEAYGFLPPTASLPGSD